MQTNGHTQINITAAKKTKQPATQDVPDMEKLVVPVTLYGLSDLIVNNFTEKSINEMEYQRSGAVDARAKKKERPPVIPEERFQASRILDEQGRDCVESRWVKAALVTASKYPDSPIPSTQLRGLVFVKGDLLPLTYKGKPIMRRDIVRVGKFPNKQPDIRYRASYRDWSLKIEVEFEPKLITLGALTALIRRAGSSVGLCEWRPEKSPGGIYGRFDVQKVSA